MGPFDADPLTRDPPGPVRRPLLTQDWLDVTMLHWEADPALVAPLLPQGTQPDVLDGRTYAGLVALRMHRVGLGGLPPVPYLGSFPETNVRLYSVDGRGRRGVVFLSLDAGRLLPALLGRTLAGLPYAWSRSSVRRDGDVLTYTSVRRLPGGGPFTRIAVRTGERIARPGELADFLTARWGLHTTIGGRTVHLPVEHGRWPLHRAVLLEGAGDLLSAAGIPGCDADAPVDVLHSPGVRVRFGAPTVLVRPSARSAG